MHAETACYFLFWILIFHGRKHVEDKCICMSAQCRHILPMFSSLPPANLQCAASTKLLRARGTPCTSKIKKPLFGNQCTAPLAWAEQTCQLSWSLNNHSFGACTSETALTQIAESQHWLQELCKIQRNTLCSVNSTVQNLLRGGYVLSLKKRTGTGIQGALCWA